jgi:hypothetical protein
MSLVRVRDPRVAVVADDGRSHIVKQGGQRVTEHREPAQSYNSQSIQWAWQPPSTSTVVTRDWRVRVRMRITAVGGNFQIGHNDALSSFPIAAITENVLLNINGDATSVQLSDIAPALRTVNNSYADRTLHWSGTTAMPDAFQRFSDFMEPGAMGGSARNPLAAYGENSAEPPRGGFFYEYDEVKDPEPPSVIVEVVEPLFISPLIQRGGDDEGMVNVNQFTLQLQLKSDLGLVWSHASVTAHNPTPNPITAVTVEFLEPPELLMRYITPDALQAIPEKQTLPYYRPQQYVKTLTPGLANNATLPLVPSDAVKLGQVPARALIFARRSRATSSLLTTQNFLRLTQLSLTFDNQAGLFASASEQHLWQMSVKNGSNLSYPEWRRYRGSVCVVDFGEDIGLPDDLAPGTQGQFNVQWYASFQNVSGAAIDAEYYVVYIYEGSYEIVPNSARSTLGNLTRGEVLASTKEAPEIHASVHESAAGGSFFSKLKHFVHNLAVGVGKAAQVAAPVLAAVAPEAAPIAMAAGKAAQAVGSATGGATAGGRIAGGRLGRQRMMS